jgi:Protein of unknown function (DUF1573)
MCRYSLVLLAGLSLAGPASATTWADAMFEDLSKDFGSVPRGPTLQHPFRLVNKTQTTVSIANVRVSCGCVTATALKSTLAPGEETAVVAQMDTRRFSGARTVTIYVQFDRPAWEEVRLWVQANSRDDVSVTPDTLTFGRAKRGATPTGTVTVTFLGNSGSQITDVQSDSNYVRTALQEVSRQDSEVTYRVTAKVRPDTPVGKWYTDVWLQTNDPGWPRVRVPLTVEIESALSVSPPKVQFGSVKVGSESVRRVIVRGVKDFRITEVKGGDGALGSLLVRDSTRDSRPVHVLTITLKGDKAGDRDRTLRVITDLPNEPEIDFKARAQVVPGQ